MLGRSLAELCEAQARPYRALSRSLFDLEQPDLSALPLEENDQVFNAAAYTAVDQAESEPERAHVVNAETPARIAAHCRARGARFVYVSSDYVFDGKATTPYRPSAERSPQNAYGRSKADGERLVHEAYPEALIVRTSWVFSPWGKNFVITMAELLRTRPEVRVVSDQVGCPTYAPDLGQALLDLTRKGLKGIWHYANGPSVSWYEFAESIQEAQRSKARLIPVSSAEFPRPAPRPSYSVLDLEETISQLGPPTNFRERLSSCVAPHADI
jgi:dTDP-4-dehydrorhamnose reductase